MTRVDKELLDELRRDVLRSLDTETNMDHVEQMAALEGMRRLADAIVARLGQEAPTSTCANCLHALAYHGRLMTADGTSTGICAVPPGDCDCELFELLIPGPILISRDEVVSTLAILHDAATATDEQRDALWDALESVRAIRPSPTLKHLTEERDVALARRDEAREQRALAERALHEANKALSAMTTARNAWITIAGNTQVNADKVAEALAAAEARLKRVELWVDDEAIEDQREGYQMAACDVRALLRIDQ